MSRSTLTGVYKNMTRGIVALVFRCHTTGGTLRLTNETTAADWLTADQVRQHLTDAYAVRLRDALAEGPRAIRTHDGTHLL
jgi:8-oxo-dGTP diphosphatase